MKLICTFLCGVALLACSRQGDRPNWRTGDDSEANKALYNEAMRIHDAVMPRMDEVYRLKTSLKARLDTLKDLTDADKAGLIDAMAQLDSADQTMRRWMRDFEIPADSVDSETVRAYMELQIERVKEVQSAITESIEAAKAKLQ